MTPARRAAERIRERRIHDGFVPVDAVAAIIEAEYRTVVEAARASMLVCLWIDARIVEAGASFKDGDALAHVESLPVPATILREVARIASEHQLKAVGGEG